MLCALFGCGGGGGVGGTCVSFQERQAAFYWQNPARLYAGEPPQGVVGGCGGGGGGGTLRLPPLALILTIPSP